MSLLTCRHSFGCLVTILIIAAITGGCGNKAMGEAQPAPPPSLTLLPLVQPQVRTTGLPTGLPTLQPSPTRFVLGPLFNPDLDLRADPIALPLELQIPALKVNAPVIGVGLTPGNVMDAPKGPIGDRVWHTAFWYRGSGIPGEIGTATIAGHVNDPLGVPEIFAHLQDLRPGDLVIVHVNDSTSNIRFIVDQVKIYSLQESSDPAVLKQVYGAGPVAGTGPQPATDGLAHLSLITCSGNIVNGEFDHHTVVYATRSP